MSVPKVDSGRIVDALHKAMNGTHICFDEVKNGSTYLSGHLCKFDFLAIKKTWAPVTIEIVEVKVSRGDFLRDDKWPKYLPSCNKFSWACPRELIHPKEIDPKAGLIWYNEEAGSIRTVKKAVYRDVPPDPFTLLYLLLWRHEGTEKDVRDKIREEMASDKKLGEDYRCYVARRLQEARDGLRDHEDRHAMPSWVKDVGKWMKEKKIPDYMLVQTLNDSLIAQGAKRIVSDIQITSENMERELGDLKKLMERVMEGKKPENDQDDL
jgi:hypothetical protein